MQGRRGNTAGTYTFNFSVKKCEIHVTFVFYKLHNMVDAKKRFYDGFHMIALLKFRDYIITIIYINITNEFCRIAVTCDGE